MSARFGPAGNAENFPYKASADAPKWLRELGLDCYEYQCGKGVHVGEATARKVGAAAAEHGISLSLHAPYFINLANPDRDALQKTIGYITGACRVADWMGAERVVIHSGALMGRTRREALDTARRSLREVIAACDGAGFGHLTLCPETMGKLGQLGDLDEVLDLCALDGRLLPCVDFGHLYARSLGAEDGPEAMERMLSRMEEVLGAERASRFHSHFSHIEFTPNGGEKCHVFRRRGLRPGLGAAGPGGGPARVEPHLYLRERGHPGGGRADHEKDLSKFSTGHSRMNAGGKTK